MTQRLRTQSHRVLQPVAQHISTHGNADSASADGRLTPSTSYAEAHVVVFVHGFRVRLSRMLYTVIVHGFED